jgi:glutamate-1-semialdehyde 2,1-aminomutase
MTDEVPIKAPFLGARAVITTCEVNDNHGTGAAVKRIVGSTPNVLSIRSMDLYGGNHDFGQVSVRLTHRDRSKREAVQNTITALAGHTVRQIYCVPYVPEDLVTAMAVQDVYKAPLAAHIMDDQNISTPNIPDDLMGEFLTKCSLVLVTCPELQSAYETKFGVRCWLLPSLVADHLISRFQSTLESSGGAPRVGALLGSISSQSCFDRLCATISGAQVPLDWYNGSVQAFDDSKYGSLNDDTHGAQQIGIRPCGLLPEQQLAEILKGYSYLVAPTGRLDDVDANPRLWRILFAVAAANLPVITLGDPTTSAAYFVRRFDVGVNCPYEGDSLRRAVEGVIASPAQARLRHNAALIAPRLSAKGVGDWLWASIDLGEPVDSRFEELLPRMPYRAVN